MSATEALAVALAQLSSLSWYTRHEPNSWPLAWSDHNGDRSFESIEDVRAYMTTMRREAESALRECTTPPLEPRRPGLLKRMRASAEAAIEAWSRA